MAAQRASSTKFQLNRHSQVNIVLPESATPSEKTAASELQQYLAQVTGGKFTILDEKQASGRQADAKQPVIAVGATSLARQAGIDTKALAEEEWRLKTLGRSFIVAGGGDRGTLYAAYHFLEGFAGVRWWSPFEEHVPSGKTLTLNGIDKSGRPAFAYRDIFTLYGYDDGRFMARSRLNRQGDAPVAAKYGGSRSYGPPDHAHTFYLYLPPSKYYDAHPDWYYVPSGGRPTPHNSQLCLSNQEMRREFLKVFKENIRASRSDALAKQLPPPKVYGISQEDNGTGFECGNAELIAREGGGSAALLDFINYLADGIRDEFPDVYIDTLAYYSAEKAPKTMHARDNVIVRLTDTTSNVLLPVTHQRNHITRTNLEAWAKRCKNLRVWDYDVTYTHPSIPTPQMPTYAPDLRFFLKHNVEGLFIEFPYALYADMRELKIWVLCKLLENPELDTEALIDEFVNGYYGAAAPKVRQYLKNLDAAATRSRAEIDWYAKLGQFSYLTLDFLRQSDALFEQAAAAVAKSPVHSRRVRRARYSIDDAALLRYPRLLIEWKRTGKPAADFPLNKDAIAARWLQTQHEQIDLQMPVEKRAAEKASVAGTLKRRILEKEVAAAPAKFAAIPGENLYLYGPDDMRNHENRPKAVADPVAEAGITTRFEIPDSEIDKYKLPMPWGVYDAVNDDKSFTGTITLGDLPESGYRWYRIPDVTFKNNSAFAYFFWSWVIQVDLDYVHDSENPDQKYDLWASIKFEGPAFRPAETDGKNAISVDRVVLVRK